MMLENYLRHVKPSEFNRSVIWASRIGLVLLILVTIVATVPFVTQQVQRKSSGSDLWYWERNLSEIEFDKSIQMEFVNNDLPQVNSSFDDNIANGNNIPLRIFRL